MIASRTLTFAADSCHQFVVINKIKVVIKQERVEEGC
jgi:hypothetical protein